MRGCDELGASPRTRSRSPVGATASGARGTRLGCIPLLWGHVGQRKVPTEWCRAKDNARRAHTLGLRLGGEEWFFQAAKTSSSGQNGKTVNDEPLTCIYELGCAMAGTWVVTRTGDGTASIALCMFAQTRLRHNDVPMFVRTVIIVATVIIVTTPVARTCVCGNSRAQQRR